MGNRGIHKLYICDHITLFSLQDAVERGWFTAECSQIRGENDYGRALALAAQIASAMAFLHANNIVHGVRGCQPL